MHLIKKGAFIRVFFCMALLPFLARAETAILEVTPSKLPVPFEPWVKRAKVFSGNLSQENCLSIQPDAVVKSNDKKVWMSEAQGHKGVLVVQPLTPGSPALIILPISTPDVGKTLVITGRGSDTKPGGKIVIKSGETVLKETQIDNEWVNLEVVIPSETKEIRVEWHAIEWAWEMLWIDQIAIKDTPLP